MPDNSLTWYTISFYKPKSFNYSYENRKIIKKFPHLFSKTAVGVRKETHSKILTLQAKVYKNFMIVIKQRFSSQSAKVHRKVGVETIKSGAVTTHTQFEFLRKLELIYKSAYIFIFTSYRYV